MLLARGRNARFIQDELFLSNHTVKSHIYSIYRKLNIHTRQELIDLIEKEKHKINRFV
jgi:DNA-binding NarL/FixJ family response regulator